MNHSLQCRQTRFSFSDNWAASAAWLLNTQPMCLRPSHKETNCKATYRETAGRDGALALFSRMQRSGSHLCLCGNVEFQTRDPYPNPVIIQAIPLACSEGPDNCLHHHLPPARCAKCVLQIKGPDSQPSLSIPRSCTHVCSLSVCTPFSVSLSAWRFSWPHTHTHTGLRPVNLPESCPQ